MHLYLHPFRMRCCASGLRILIYGSLVFLSINFMINYLGSALKNSFSLLRIDSKHSIVSYAGKNRSVVSVKKTTTLTEVTREDVEIYSTYGDREDFNKSNIICQTRILEKGGPLKPNITLESLNAVEERFKTLVKSGGWFIPSSCVAKYHVAVVVPFRDRYAHLSIFLKNIHPFLMRQNIEYRIYIIEQTNGKQFNRAALMNVGYIEALKFSKWDCFIFHDVDLIPLDERNLYTCPNQPRHMSVAIDIFGYNSIFGGVSAMSRTHFSKVNGFSNSFWGWGGEDDDMSNRLKHANLYISRYPINIARYKMLHHHKEKANPKRYENLINGANKFKMDGLNSIKYDVYSTKEFPLFTWLLVELKMVEQR